MKLDIKAIIPAVILLIVHFICFILWIAGWAASKQLDSNSENGSDSANPHRYYFTWGFLVSLSMMVATVGTCIPVSAVRKASLLALVFFIIVFAIPLSVVMGQSSAQLSYEDCGDLADSAKDLCNGYKTLFVSCFFYMIVLAAKVVYAMLMWQREATEADSFRQSFDRA